MEFFSFLWMYVYIHRMSSEFILKALESITTDPQYSIIIKIRRINTVRRLSTKYKMVLKLGLMMLLWIDP